MKIKIKNKDVELKFVYNSFRYMEDLDVTELETMNQFPFKIPRICEMLLLGASNCDPDNPVTPEEVRWYMEGVLKEGTLVELVTMLTELLEESDFFKQLQEPEMEG